jgi:hypothetical protein
MEEQVNKLIEKIESDSISHYDFNEVLDMLKDLLVSNKEFSIGAIIKVTSCIYGHEFDLGEIIAIKDYEPTKTTSWLCSNGKNNWWLSEDEAIVI